MIKEKLNTRTIEFEKLLQEIASAIASGVISEKLPPSILLKKTENYVNRLHELAASNQESMLVLKPEKAPTIKAKYKNLSQTLTTFKDILHQNTSDLLANSRLALEQLRKGLTDGSDFLFLMRDVRDAPSPLINRMLAFKKSSETKGSVMNIQASEDIRPLLEYVLRHIEELSTGLSELEKRVSGMKQSVRELQDESLKVLSPKNEEDPRPMENKTEKRQLSLSSFKPEQN